MIPDGEDLYGAYMAFNPYILVSGITALIISLSIQILFGLDDISTFSIAIGSYALSMPLILLFGHKGAMEFIKGIHWNHWWR